MSQNETLDLETLVDTLRECKVEEKQPAIALNNTCESLLLQKFPKPKHKVPPIFLHKPVKFPPLMRKVLNLGIKFYRPVAGNHYTKINCQTFDDHKTLKQYFQNKHLPYHTYGHPDKRKMKVVFKGLPKDIDIDKLKTELKLVSIPVIRIHKMKNKECAKDLPPLLLVVVPNDDEGRKILQVKKYFGRDIKLEALKPRSMQCFRCQKWGHSQRYCNGHFKCVKCGGDHLYRKCDRDPTKEPPKCANCGSDHTSSYKLCPFSPDSPQYAKKMSASEINKALFPGICILPKKLVTLNNCHLFLRDKI